MMTTTEPSALSLLDTIRQRGLIRIPVQWDDTSAQYLDPDSGEPAGVVGLVGHLLAADLGVALQFVEIPWAEQIPALLAGEVDVSIKHTNTPHRAFEVEFTLFPIICEEGRIVVRRDRGLPNETALNRPECRLAVARGSSQEIHVRRRYPQAEVWLLPTAQDTLDAVANGEADACLHDTLVPGFLASQPDCTVLTTAAGQPVTPYRDCVHPCLKPGDSRFLNWLNSWLAFHRAAGTFETIITEAETAFQAKFHQTLGI